MSRLGDVMLFIMKIAVYPGSFDPCTNGHLDVIARASDVFEKLIVAVLENKGKKPLFTSSERADMLRKVTKDLGNVEIMEFSGLLVDFLEREKANIIIKGLRAISDFEYEIQMAHMNTKLNPKVQTLFMPTTTQNSFVSSSVVKEIAAHKGDITDLVPKVLIEEIKSKFA